MFTLNFSSIYTVIAKIIIPIQIASTNKTKASIQLRPSLSVKNAKKADLLANLRYVVNTKYIETKNENTINNNTVTIPIALKVR